MTVEPKVKTEIIFICVSIMSPISNPPPFLTHSRCHYLLYLAKVCFSPMTSIFIYAFVCWHCISLSEKLDERDGAMTKSVSKFIATLWIADRWIGGFLFAFANEFLGVFARFRPGRCASACQVSRFNCSQTKVKSQLQLDLAKARAKFTFHHRGDWACAANLRANKQKEKINTKPGLSLFDIFT